METILYIVAILDWILMIYLPIVGIYGLIRLQIDPNPMNTIRSPLFGIGEFGFRKGMLIWAIQLIMLGVVLMQYATWHRGGDCPFIQVW